MKNQFIQNLENLIHEQINTLVEAQDYSALKTPLKNGAQLKAEFKNYLEEFIKKQPTPESFERAIALLDHNLHLVASPEEVELAKTEIQKSNQCFIDFLELVNKRLENGESFKEEDLSESEQSQTFQEVFGFSDETLLTFYKLASYYIEHKEFEKGKDILQLLLYLSPEISSYWLAMGVCEQKAGHFENAIEYYRYADLINESSPLALIYTADCCIEKGDREQARENIRKATEKTYLQKGNKEEWLQLISKVSSKL